MAERKDCTFYDGCTYREEFGYCAHFCMKYRNEESDPDVEKKSERGYRQASSTGVLAVVQDKQRDGESCGL